MAEFPALQSSYAAGEVAPALRARVDLAKYRVGLQRQRNMFSVVHGGSVNRAGSQYVDQIYNMAAVGRLVSFKYSTTDTYVLEFGNLVMRVYRNGALVLSGGVPYVLATPYATDKLADLKFTQSFDRMRITHKDFDPYSLTRSGHASWTITAITSNPATPSPSGTATNAPGTAYGYMISAVNDETGEESYPDGPTVSATQTSTISFSPVTGCTYYNVYKSDVNGVYGFIGRAKSGSNAFIDASFTPDTSLTPRTFRAPFNAVNKKPECSTYWAQRSFYGSSWSAPQTVWASVAGALENMTTSQPTQADDAITKTLNARSVNAIRHMVPLEDLLLFTSGGLWRGTANGSPEGVTPTTLEFLPQTETPISNLPPIVAGEDVLFTHEKGSIVYRVSFEAISTRWRPTNISVLSAHLFKGMTVTEWCYAEVPFNLVWGVRSDGKLVSLTYLKEQEVYAWALHDIAGGVVESICSVSEGTEDVVYMIVRRTINGGTKRYVEKFHSRSFANLADCWFLDCALRYNGAPANVISGLDHLEGQAVVVLADGVVIRGLTVTGGAITLATAASVVLVGLGYDSDMQTLGVETQPTVQGKPRRVAAATLHVEASRGGKVGPDFTYMSNMPYLDSIGDPGTARELFTGETRVLIENDWDTGGAVCIRQSDPLPLTVLGDVLEVAVG